MKISNTIFALSTYINRQAGLKNAGEVIMLRCLPGATHWVGHLKGQLEQTAAEHRLGWSRVGRFRVAADETSSNPPGQQVRRRASDESAGGGVFERRTSSGRCAPNKSDGRLGGNRLALVRIRIGKADF